jgi:hypothetical protein
LAIRIVRVKFDATTVRDESLNLCGKTFAEWTLNPSVAGVSYGVKFCFSLFSGQFLHMFYRGRLVKILPEYLNM